MTHALDSTGVHGAPTTRGTHPHTWMWAAVIVALVVVAGAIGYAVYDNATGGETSPGSVVVPSTDSNSVAIVQSEIDAALALRTALPSSVAIVNAEIEDALARRATGSTYPELSAAERTFLAEHGMTPPRP